MIKRNQRYFNWINRLLDIAVLVASYMMSVWFWIYYLEKDAQNIAVKFAVENPLPMLLVFFAFMVIYQYAGLYDSYRFRTLLTEYAKLFVTHTACMGLAVGTLFIFKITGFSRGVMVCFFVVSLIMLMAKRVVLRVMLRVVRRQGYNQKFVVIIGDGELAEKYLDSIRDNPQYGFKSIGYIGEEGNIALGAHLGNFDALDSALDMYNPDEVIIALEQYELGIMNAVINSCEEQGIRANIVPIYNDYLPPCASVDSLGYVRLINIRASALDVTLNKVAKRAFDIVFALLALTITSPVMALTAICVKLTSPGPVLFKQTRVGCDRKEFTMYKFRSMRVNDESDRAWSKPVDNRTTPVGAFIRKFSIDELPQFFNVLKGDMSVVGPRPELPYFVQKYKTEIPKYMVKHQVKPGITGWAQVNGFRGDTSLTMRINYDIWYIENWSFLLDIKIIIMTVFGGMINGEKNLMRDRETVDV